MATSSLINPKDEVKTQNFTACYRCNMICRDSDMDLHRFYQCLVRPLLGIAPSPIGICPHCNKKTSLAKMQFHLNDECPILTEKCPFCQVRKHNLIEHFKIMHSENQHLQEYINVKPPPNPYIITQADPCINDTIQNNKSFDSQQNEIPNISENIPNGNNLITDTSNINTSNIQFPIPEIKKADSSEVNEIDCLVTNGNAKLQILESEYNWYVKINDKQLFGVKNPNNSNAEVVCPHCDVLFQIKTLFDHFNSLRFKCVFCSTTFNQYDTMQDHLYSCSIMPRPFINCKLTSTRCLFCLRDIPAISMVMHYAQFHCWYNPKCLFCHQRLDKIEHLQDCIKRKLVLRESVPSDFYVNSQVFDTNSPVDHLITLSTKLASEIEIHEENYEEKLSKVWNRRLNPQVSNVKIQCTWCSLQFSRDKIAEHFLTHKHILLDCLLCNNDVLLTNLINHSDACILQLLKLNNNLMTSDIKCKCPLCSDNFLSSKLKSHIASTHLGLARIIQCPQCNGYVKLFKIFEHLEYCIKIEYMSRNSHSLSSSRSKMLSRGHSNHLGKEKNDRRSSSKSSSPKRDRNHSHSSKNSSIKKKKEDSMKVGTRKRPHKTIRIKNYNKTVSTNLSASNMICTVCSKPFNVTNLTSHIYGHSNNYYNCPMCKKKYTLINLKPHIQRCLKKSKCSVPDGKLNKCILCHSRLSRVDVNHIGSHVKVNCPICSKVYKFSFLQEHILTCIQTATSHDISSTLHSSRMSSPSNNNLLIDVQAQRSPLLSQSDESDHFDLVGAWCTPEPDTSLCETSNWTQELQFDVFISEDEKLLVSSNITAQ